MEDAVQPSENRFNDSTAQHMTTDQKPGEDVDVTDSGTEIIAFPPA